MDGEQVLIGENSLWLDLFNFATEEWLIDEPRTAIVQEDFLSDELLVFLEVGDEMFEVFPSEGDAACSTILLDQINCPYAEVVVVDAVAVQNYLVHCSHDLNHSL